MVCQLGAYKQLVLSAHRPGSYLLFVEIIFDRQGRGSQEAHEPFLAVDAVIDSFGHSGAINYLSPVQRQSYPWLLILT